MSDFDPYHKWLGIPPQEQPAHYYRLLGITDFEVDREVISAAAEQRTVYLRMLQAGEHELLVAQLLNEISQARVTLLNENEKVAYDEELRKQQTPEPVSEPTPVPIPLVQVPTPTPVVVRGTVTQDFPLSVVQTAKGPRSRKPKEIWKPPAVIGVSLLGVIGVFVLFISMMPAANTLPPSLLEGLVAYYPFNGNADDESGNGNHGIVRGGAMLAEDRHGNTSEAYLFDGRDDYISAPHHPKLNFPGGELTIGIWINLKNISRTARLIGKDMGSGARPKWFLSVGNEQFNPPSLGFLVHSPGNPTAWFGGNPWRHGLEEWHHCVIAKSGKDVKIYVDGVIVDTIRSVLILPSSNTAALTIGQAEGNGWVNGSIDDVRIYNRALSEAEVKALYEFEKP